MNGLDARAFTTLGIMTTHAYHEDLKVCVCALFALAYVACDYIYYVDEKKAITNSHHSRRAHKPPISLFKHTYIFGGLSATKPDALLYIVCRVASILRRAAKPIPHALFA